MNTLKESLAQAKKDVIRLTQENEKLVGERDELKKYIEEQISEVPPKYRQLCKGCTLPTENEELKVKVQELEKKVPSVEEMRKVIDRLRITMHHDITSAMSYDIANAIKRLEERNG